MAIDLKKAKRQTNIKKWNEEIRTNRKDTDRSEREIGCICTHQYPNGEVSIIPTKQRNADGSIIYKCLQCDKAIRITPVDMAKLDDAIETVSQACDIIKFTANPKSDTDVAIAVRVGKMQSKVVNELRKYYVAALDSSKHNRNRGKHNGQRNDGGNIMGRSVSGR